MTNRNLAFLGAALLVAGLFMPVVTMPFLGNVNLFSNGSNEVAIILVVLAAASAGLAAKDRVGDVIWPGAAAGGILIYLFLRLQYNLSEMRESLAEDLAGNPFAGMAQTALGSVQLQWGWLVLAVGAGLLVYAAVKGRNDEEAKLFSVNDSTARIVAIVSVVLLLAAPAWEFIAEASVEEPAVAASTADMDMNTALGITGTDAATGPSQEEAAYIRNNLRLYDLNAKYFESLLDGRIPGVKFKIKNEGDWTLNGVDVRVVFYDESGQPIAEENYHPVLVSEYSFGNDNTPLRPNYIWQQEPDSFYGAKAVPTEWETGKVTATITDIEFGPNE